MQAPEAQARVEVTDLALDPARPLKPDVQLDARLARGQLTADFAVTGLGDRALTGNLALPMALALQPFEAAVADDAPLRGRIDGGIDLARLMALAPVQGLQLLGELQVGLGLGGTKAQPAVNGAVTLAGGSLQDLSSGIDLVDLALRLEGRGRSIALTSLAASGRTGGALRATGEASLLPDGGVGYNAAVDLDRLRVLNNELGTAVLSSDVDASGDQRGARVSGTLRLDGADITIPDGGGPSIPVIDVQEVNATPDRSSGLPEPAAGPPFDLVLDLRIEAPARLFVRGRGLDSEWGGTLSVRGPATAPEIIGELEFRRGFLDLLDKRFQIRRGIISFVGSQPPLPMIDLEATARSEEIQAVVRLRGPVADPTLELSSEPVLPQDEILSRLLFGRSVARITPVQGLRLAAAVDTLRGGGGLSDMLSSLRRGLGVDTLDVGGETAQESTARAGKYLTDNVFLEIERGVAAGSTKARVQVELTPNLSVNTEVDEQSRSGVGLEYRYDY
jgi:translocation and assembly module TamB